MHVGDTFSELREERDPVTGGEVWRLTNRGVISPDRKSARTNAAWPPTCRRNTRCRESAVIWLPKWKLMPAWSGHLRPES